jgi:hypothetical protein
MGRERTPAIRLELGKVLRTEQARRPDNGYALSGVLAVELVGGATMYRCEDCLLLWPTSSPAVRHRRVDEPHVVGGSVPVVSPETLPEIDTYASSRAVEPAGLPVPAPRAARPRAAVDRESYLDANAGAVAVSVAEFLDTLIASREAARIEAAEQRERAERAIRSEAKMRKVLVQMTAMIKEALGETGNDE